MKSPSLQDFLRTLASATLPPIAALLLALAPPASAAIYKCVDLDGTTSYSKRACGDLDLLDRVIADNGFTDARRPTRDAESADSRARQAPAPRVPRSSPVTVFRN